MPNYYPPASGGAGGGTPDDNSVTSAKIVDGAIVNADINAAAAIALSKLASDPLARANHTGTQLLATISDAGTLAALSAVASAQITDGTIVGGDLSATIAIPSAATLTTQTTGDSSTKGASTAFVQATVANGETVFFSDGTFMPFPMAAVNSSGAAVSATNAARSTRFVCPKTGTLANLAVFVTASSGNFDVGIYDTNDASATNRTKIWTAGSTAVGTANNYQSFTPSVAMVAGRQYDFMLSADNGTATFAKIVGQPNVNMGNLPVAFNVVAGGATAKQYGIATSQFPLSTTTIAEASVTTGGIGFWFVGKIT